MKRVVFGFSRARSKYAIFSRAICWAQETPFSHVYVKFEWPAAQANLIYHASRAAVNFEPEHKFLQHAHIVAEYSLELNDEAWGRTARFIVENLGKPYSVSEILGFAYRCAASKLGHTVPNPVRNGRDEFICSELAADLLNTALQTEHVDPEQVGPREFYELLKKAYPGLETV